MDFLGVRCGWCSFKRRRAKAFAGLFAAGCYPAAIFRPSRSAWKLQRAFGDTPICAKSAHVYMCVRVRACVGVLVYHGCLHVSTTPRYQPFCCRQPTGELLFLLPLLLLPLRRCLSGSLISSFPLSFRRPRSFSLFLSLFETLPSLQTRKGWGGKKSRRRHFLGEIRMYVPPYPDLLRGIRRVQGRRGAETAWPLNVDVDCVDSAAFQDELRCPGFLVSFASERGRW